MKNLLKIVSQSLFLKHYKKDTENFKLIPDPSTQAQTSCFETPKNSAFLEKFSSAEPIIRFNQQKLFILGKDIASKFNLNGS